MKMFTKCTDGVEVLWSKQMFVFRVYSRNMITATPLFRRSSPSEHQCHSLLGNEARLQTYEPRSFMATHSKQLYEI